MRAKSTNTIENELIGNPRTECNVLSMFAVHHIHCRQRVSIFQGRRDNRVTLVLYTFTLAGVLGRHYTPRIVVILAVQQYLSS